jgi:predicted  nucleic acid-binding Zn-ribbon protein
MSSTLIKFRINETERNLRNATDSQEIAQLEKDLKDWKRHLHDAEMIEFEERVGFKSMERNAGVWGER